MADNLFVLGQIHAELGNFENALSAYRRAFAIDEKISDAEHPDALEVPRELAVLFGRQSDLGQSLSTSVELFKRQRHHLIQQILALADPAVMRFLQNSFQSAEVFHSVCAEASAQGPQAPHFPLEPESWR